MLTPFIFILPSLLIESIAPPQKKSRLRAQWGKGKAGEFETYFRLKRKLSDRLHILLSLTPIFRWMPVKHKRRVVAVRFAWRQKSKDEIIGAMVELERHRAGRKARRQGTAEYVADEEYDAKADMLQREGAALDLNPAFLSGIQQAHRKNQ